MLNLKLAKKHMFFFVRTWISLLITSSFIVPRQGFYGYCCFFVWHILGDIFHDRGRHS